MIQRLSLQETLNLLNRKIKISSISALGTYLVLYSSLIPFSNNILESFYPETKSIIIEKANNNLSAVIWSLGICIQPTIFIISLRMRPYLWSYSLPLFTSIYSTSFYLLPLFGYTPKEDAWFFACIFVIVFIILFLVRGINLFFKASKAKEELLMRAYKLHNDE
jgi:FtsH-binding integral membrane protein